MAGDVDDVVDPTHQPVVAVLVLLRAVARHVDLGPVLGEVRRDVALVVAEERAEHPGPGALHHEEAARATLHRVSLLVHDLGSDAGEGTVAEPGFVVTTPGSGVIRMPPFSGLPPRVDDRAALAADHLPVPEPASGLIGSPTVPSTRSEERSWRCGYSSPTFTNERISVGAV